MRVIAKRTLREFWEIHPDSETPLRDWHRAASRADWRSPAQLRASFPNASIVGGNRAVFRIRGNRYRLVVKIFYPGRIVYVLFIGTHAEYDRINAKEI